jgi:hypothetical protein
MIGLEDTRCNYVTHCSGSLHRNFTCCRHRRAFKLSRHCISHSNPRDAQPGGLPSNKGYRQLTITRSRCLRCQGHAIRSLNVSSRAIRYNRLPSRIPTAPALRTINSVLFCARLVHATRLRCNASALRPCWPQHSLLLSRLNLYTLPQVSQHQLLFRLRPHTLRLTFGLPIPHVLPGAAQSHRMEDTAEVSTAMTMAHTGRWHVAPTGQGQPTMTLRELLEILRRL